MPNYDYACDACGHEFEVFQPMTENPKRKCPDCKKHKLYRKIGSGAGVIFKGSGFYETDYRSASYKKGAAADKASRGDSESKSSKKADSKAAQKTDSASKPDAPQKNTD